MPTQQEIRDSINAQIIAALEQGTAPWRCPWSNDPCIGAPANAVSGKRYAGVNPLVLQLASQRHQFQSRFWATYRQWCELGGQVQSRPSEIPPGKWGTTIVFCKPVSKTKRNENGEEVEEKFWTLRTYTVFNVDQVVGNAVDRFRAGLTPTTNDLEPRFQRAQDVIDATKADIQYGGNEAFYRPDDDFIQMPHRHQFQNPSDFWETLLHEMMHWTEHPTRLNWDRKLPENSYALGELIAEIGACYTAAELGLPLSNSLANHVAYLQNWLQAMQNDSRFLFRAAAQATKATDFLVSFSRAPEPEDESLLVV